MISGSVNILSHEMIFCLAQEVRIGPIDLPGGTSTSVDLEDSNPPPAPGMLSSSPPQSMQMEKTKENHTPPSSPNVNHPGILGR